jgi:hypothetical protein
MNKRNALKIIGLGFLLYNYLLLISCQENTTLIDDIEYNDLLVTSPSIRWGSSPEELKRKYPNVVNESGDNMTFDEYNLNGKVWRSFRFIDNKLWGIFVSYGEYGEDELDLLRNDLQEKHGISSIHDNGTIETWDLGNNEYTQIVFVTNKLMNNTVNCSYLNPPLRDLQMSRDVYIE